MSAKLIPLGKGPTPTVEALAASIAKLSHDQEVLQRRVATLESEQRAQDQNDRDALLMIVAQQERRLGLRPRKERNTDG